MKIQKYKQTTVESCLACCMLQLAHNTSEISITKEEEQNMLFHALSFTREDFVVGHIDFFKKFNISLVRYVDNKDFYNYIKKISITEIKQHKITLDFIDSFLEKKSVIVSLDIYYLHENFHYPHWIIILKKENNNYQIYDPWDGKIKNIQSTSLSYGLHSYISRFWMAPQLITYQENLGEKT